MGVNPYLYDIATEAELSEVLSHYNTEYVLDVLRTMMAARFTPNSVMTSQPNLVSAWETNFKELHAYYAYPEFQTKIEAVRENTYKEIIQTICQEFQLNFTIDETIDFYSAAYFLYEFFVANFNQNVIQFMATYIFKERSAIYEAMNLAATRKNKDTSTTYGKRLYKDIKLVTINASIDSVVSNICGMDIDLATIMLNIYPKEKAMYILQLVSPMGDFFKNYYGNILNSPIKPVLLTEIRFALQNIASAHDALNRAPEDTINAEI